jgi:phosphoadenosine phosphosulfate reductase
MSLNLTAPASSDADRTAPIVEAAQRLAGAPAEEILRWGLATYGKSLAIASSFSLEDCVVIDMAWRIDKSVRVFALDTGRLPEETYLCAERMRMKYDLSIEWQYADRVAVEALLRDKGLYSFRDSLDNRHECCGIRKVVPLKRVLGTLGAWVTGLRREQSVTRTDMAAIEVDRDHGSIAKLSPIIGWTWDDVRAYAQKNKVPVHALHDKGYPSIGCAPCTRAVAPGEHPRAGRWWWENPDSKECGLHKGG